VKTIKFTQPKGNVLCCYPGKECVGFNDTPRVRYTVAPPFVYKFFVDDLWADGLRAALEKIGWDPQVCDPTTEDLHMVKVLADAYDKDETFLRYNKGEKKGYRPDAQLLSAETSA